MKNPTKTQQSDRTELRMNVGCVYAQTNLNTKKHSSVFSRQATNHMHAIDMMGRAELKKPVYNNSGSYKSLLRRLQFKSTE